MNRMSRNAVTAALAAAVAFGVTAPAATAAPNAHAGAGHTRAGHAKTDHARSDHGHKADKTGHRLANAQRKVTTEALRKDRFLAKVLRRDALSRLDAATADAVRANVAADRALLDGYRTAAAGATALADVVTVAKQVRQVRPEVYNTVVNQLGFAARLQARATRYATSVAELGGDPTAVDAAAAALTSAVADYVTFTATTSRVELNAAKRELAAAVRLLGEVADELDEEPAPEPAPEPEPAPADPVV